MTKRALYILLIIFLISLFYSTSFAEEYPKLDISGYKKYEFRQINVSPSRNYFLGLSHLGESYGYAAGPWQERLRLRIVGKLSKRLSVSYDMEQQPELPEKYNVKVNYDNHELTFGDFTTTFTGNEFATASKSLNGVMVTSRDNWYDLKLVPSAKVRSSTQKLTSQRGNNSRGPYSLGRGSIIEGSEYVELNGVPQKRGPDYTIDYFEGTITFNIILTEDDEFKYSYEFTNLLDLFFPTLSKRNFFGFRGSATVDPSTFGRPEPKPEPSIKEERETFPAFIREPKYITKEVTVIPTPEVTYGTAEEKDETLGVVMVNNLPIIKLINLEGIISGEARARIVAGRISSFIKGGLSPEAISYKKLNGDFAGIGKDKVLFTIDPRDAKFFETSSEALANDWVGKLRILLLPSPTTEIILVPTIEVYEPTEEEEEEGIGIYRVNNPPIIEFSEELRLRGSTLKKDVDYTIDYNTGIIKLLTPVLPTKEDNLYVTYSHYKSGAEAEILFGDGSRGPYEFTHKNIIIGSETIFIDQIPYVRDLDYVIDYDEGKVVFSFKIRETQTISIKYRYVIMKLPPPPPKPPLAQSLRVGGTFLKETAKKPKGAPSSTKIEKILTGDPGSGNYNIHDVIAANNTLYLSEYPILPSFEAQFILKINGRVATVGVDYVIPTTEANGNVYPSGTKIGFRGKDEAGYPTDQVLLLNDSNDLSDGYNTGTVRILTTVETTTTIEAIYSFKKNIRGEDSVQVGTSVTEFNINPRYRSIVPGSETVLYWPQEGGDIKELFPNIIPITGEADINDYKIDYSNAAGPKITLNQEWNDHPAWNVRVMFKYAPGSEQGEEDLSQDVIGLDATYKLGDVLKLETAWAKTTSDRVYIAVSTSETFYGTGATDYDLKSAGDIIEDSENILVENTLSGIKRLMAKDTDYFMIYSKPGRVSFAFAISSFEVVTIDYEYQSLEGIQTGQKVIKEGQAYKLAMETKPLKDVVVNMSLRETDRDFSPLGGTSIGKGSRAEEYRLNYKPGYANFTFRWNKWRDELSPTFKNTYLHKDDKNISITDINPYDVAKIGLKYRYYETKDDVLPNVATTETNPHKYDYRLKEWEISLNPKSLKYGFFTFNNSNSVRKTVSETETEDRKIAGVIPKTTDSDYFRTTNQMKLTERADFSIDHQINQPITKGPKILGNTTEGFTTKEAITNHTFTLDTTYKLNLDLTYKQFMKRLFSNIRLRNYTNENKVTDVTVKTRNTYFYLDYVPFSEFKATYTQNRDETLSIRVSGENPRTESNSLNTRYTPLRELSLSWVKNWNESFQESGARSSGNSNDYTLNYTPPSPIRNLTLKTMLKKYENTSISIQSTGDESRTITNSEKAALDTSYVPHPLVTLSNDFEIEFYKNESDTNTDIMNWTADIDARYRATSLLTINGNIFHRQTRNNLTGDERPRDKYGIKATYKVFTWGDAIYEWLLEINKGEIKAGSYTIQDFIKTSHSIGLNFRIAQDNVILENIELKARFKLLSFKNKLSETENFDASLLSLEGTLNF